MSHNIAPPGSNISSGPGSPVHRHPLALSQNQPASIPSDCQANHHPQDLALNNGPLQGPPNCHHDDCHKSYRKALKAARLLHQQGHSANESPNSHHYSHRQHHPYMPYRANYHSHPRDGKDRESNRSHEDLRESGVSLGSRYNRSDATSAADEIVKDQPLRLPPPQPLWSPPPSTHGLRRPPSPISTDSSSSSPSAPIPTHLPYTPPSSSNTHTFSSMNPRYGAPSLKSQPSTPFWTPSTSPVLGPLRGLNLEWTSRSGSRASSPTLVTGASSLGPTFPFRPPHSSPVREDVHQTRVQGGMGVKPIRWISMVNKVQTRIPPDVDSVLQIFLMNRTCRCTVTGRSFLLI
ncbi:hypothetical protein BS47DRAFT_857721 [Hydnum rufescens UP504]|uniref:Uncharacterized protein n=1 Tax=Hydnum rufescens UP504 TaxID=1448309 RepID=A0A9P6AYU8_9AGAM|nr:hypothetical protein BS47DRAFT_857721 [Hydnum rufescens UP504]